MLTNRTELALDKVAKELFTKGVQPTPAQMDAAIAKYSQYFRAGYPTMEPVSFGWREKLVLSKLNDVLGRAQDDLEFLYSEQVAQTVAMLNAVRRGELLFRSYEQQLRALEAIVRDLLLVSDQGANSMLFSVSENFANAGNINEQQTDADVDHHLGVVTLPVNYSGAERIPLRHLMEQESYSITIRKANGEVITKGATVGVDENVDLGGGVAKFVAPFGEAWTDNASAWLFDYQTKLTDGIEVEFTVPVAGLADTVIERHIGRIDIEPIENGSLGIEIRGSVDNRNFTVLPTVPERLVVDSPTTIRFPETLVQYLRFRIRQTQPSAVDQEGLNHYTIGIANISLFRAGYSEEAQVVVGPLSPPDDLQAVNAVALSVEDETPENTAIDYEVALDATNPEYIPISPRERQTDGDRVVRFADTRESLRSENKFEWQATPPSAWSSIFGLSFYRIYDGVRAGYVPNTAKLYRGAGGWYRSAVREAYTRRVTIDFPDVDDNYNRTLYLRSERELGEIKNTTSPVRVAVNNHLVPGRRGLTQTAATSDRHLVPDYAIEKVMYYSSSTSSVSFSWTGASDAQVVVSGEVTFKDGDTVYLGQSGKVFGFSVVGQPSYDGTDSTVDLTKLSSSGSGRAYDGLVDDASGSTSLYKSGRDVTNEVDTYTGRFIRFASSLTGVQSSDLFEVTYHYNIPKDFELDLDQSVVRAGGDVMLPGAAKDYVIDPFDFTLTIIPGGRISGRHSVELQYVGYKPTMEIFTTYLHLSRPVSFQWPGITVDDTVDEFAQLSMSDDGGVKVLDLSVAQQISLSAGTHQIRCKSRPIIGTSGDLQVECALYRLVNVQVGGDAFFRPGRLFDTHSAMRGPMKETTKTFLQGSSRYYDRQWFVVDGTDVIVAFDPVSSRETFYLAPGGASPTQVDRFELSYQYVTDTPATTNLLLRATLRRPGSRPDLTPVLRAFSLRLA